VKFGEQGYYRNGAPFMTEQAAHMFVARLNDCLGVTPLQAECMLVGSMFGWDVPGADPDHYKADEIARIEAWAQARRLA